MEESKKQNIATAEFKEICQTEDSDPGENFLNSESKTKEKPEEPDTDDDYNSHILASHNTHEIRIENKSQDNEPTSNPTVNQIFKATNIYQIEAEKKTLDRLIRFSEYAVLASIINMIIEIFICFGSYYNYIGASAAEFYRRSILIGYIFFLIVMIGIKFVALLYIRIEFYRIIIILMLAFNIITFKTRKICTSF